MEILRSLRRWRREHNHSQARLAMALEVHPTAISKVENRQNSLDLETFYRLIRYTGLDAMEVLEDLFEAPKQSRGDNVMDFRVARARRSRAKRVDA